MTRPSPEGGEQRHHEAFANLLAGRPSGVQESTAGFVAWAIEQRLAPYAGFIAAGLDDELGPALRAPGRTAAIKELVQAVPCRQLLHALVEKGVTPIVFKGLGVAHLYYPQPYLRPLGDLDLLFRPRDVPAMVEACQALGYDHQNKDPVVVAFHIEAHYNVPLVHPRHGLLEAHHALYRDCEDAYGGVLFDRCRPVEVLGARVEQPHVVDLFIVLSVHFGNSWVGSAWVWLLDLVLMARVMTADDWSLLVATAVRHGLQLHVATALGIMRKLWSVEGPAGPVLRELRAALRPIETIAFDRVVGLAGHGVQGAHVLTVARRLSGRRVRGTRQRLGSVFAHPGAVCDEWHVSSSSPWFWLHRLAHPAWRLTQAARSIYKAISPS